MPLESGLRDGGGQGRLDKGVGHGGSRGGIGAMARAA